ncbi:MAG: hemolysin III family protein [Chromatiales bacterium]
MYRSELINSISHLVGAVLALAAMAALITFASIGGDAWKVVSFAIYGTTLFILYLISTLYHSLRGRPKSVFRILDHQAIYLLIAGTYTPFTLIILRSSVGWWLFGAIWGMAVIGFVLDAVHPGGKRVLPMFIYIVMGWMIVFALDPLLAALPSVGFYWLLLGGIIYTVGVVFFVLDHWYPWAHGVWHLFVLAGSACHYVTILFFL